MGAFPELDLPRFVIVISLSVINQQFSELKTVFEDNCRFLIQMEQLSLISNILSVEELMSVALSFHLFSCRSLLEFPIFLFFVSLTFHVFFDEFWRKCSFFPFLKIGFFGLENHFLVFSCFLLDFLSLDSGKIKLSRIIQSVGNLIFWKKLWDHSIFE